MKTPIPEEHPHHRKYKNAPHPYIIIPPFTPLEKTTDFNRLSLPFEADGGLKPPSAPLDSKHLTGSAQAVRKRSSLTGFTRRQYFKPDDSICFEIALIGKANEYLPYFVYAFTEMGRMGIGKDRGKFDVTSVEALNLDGSGMEIFNGNTGILKGTENRIDYSLFVKPEVRGQRSEVRDQESGVRSRGKDEITISFDTPARIKADDRLSPDIPFNLLIRRLSERAFLLVHFHCGAEMGDYEEYAKGSETVENVHAANESALPRPSPYWSQYQKFCNSVY